MNQADVRPIDLDQELRAADVVGPTDGAPMLLTFIDLRERSEAAVPDTTDPDGAAYADLVEQYCDALVPWARDDDQGALITVLKTIGVTAFGPRTGGDA